MRFFLLGIGVFTLCLGCDRGTPVDRVDVDATEPGKVCEVHGLPLPERVVRIGYSLTRPTKEETEARQH